MVGRSMVERVARELCRCDGYPEDHRYEGKPMWASYADTARKVIAAMREPSRSVLAAGIEKAEELVDHSADTEGEYRCNVPSDAPMPIWQAMVDAALAESVA
jgi:hypothetical protein